MAHWFGKVLPMLGHKVLFVATSGTELVEKAWATPPDLAIADIRLPGLDGIEACERVYCERPVPFVLVSAYHDPELVDRAGFGHALVFLVKPIEPEHLGGRGHRPPQ